MPLNPSTSMNWRRACGRWHVVRPVVRRPCCSHGEIELDPAAHRVTLGGVPVELATREFSLLQALMQNAGRVMTRAQLEASLYGWRDEPDSNALEVHIHHLRKKLGADLIKTLRGVGYLISKP